MKDRIGQTIFEGCIVAYGYGGTQSVPYLQPGVVVSKDTKYRKRRRGHDEAEQIPIKPLHNNGKAQIVARFPMEVMVLPVLTEEDVIRKLEQL